MEEEGMKLGMDILDNCLKSQGVNYGWVLSVSEFLPN